MWNLYRTAQECFSRPSDLLCIEDRLAAYLLDKVVIAFGALIDNALAERVNRGSALHPNWQTLYTLEQVLDPAFFLPSSAAPEGAAPSYTEALRALERPFASGLPAILALGDQAGPNGHPGVKRWVYVPPESENEN